MTANHRYAHWISENVTPETAFARCAEWSAAMATFFPELKRIRGHVLLSTGIERSHWWLESPSGEIIDPTASQFALPYFAATILHYEPWDEAQPEPTGKCPNCGGHCFNGDYCCSDSCANAYVAYCNNPML